MAEGRSPAHAGSACAPLGVLPIEIDALDVAVPVPKIEDFSGREQLSGVHEKLARLLRGGAGESIRIGFWGDSNLTRDFISGELRRALQQRFGDAGHGYVAVGRPWSWYLHMDVVHEADDGWMAYNLSTDQIADRWYGVGGIAAQNVRPSPRAWFATAPDGSPVGRTASRVEVLYLRHPKHGSFSVGIDRGPLERVDTRSERVGAGIWRKDLADAAHRVDLVGSEDTAAPTRLLGVVLERQSPGIVVDSLGVGGVNMELFARADETVLIETLRMRRYDLVMLLTGATEPDSPKHDAATREFIGTVRKALPGVPFLMMSPPDLGGGSIKKPTRSIRINQIERKKLRIARQEGLLYWDFRGAMGGEQSIVRFAERKMAWTDFIHLTEKGGRYMGRRLAHALVDDFSRWLAAHPNSGCAPEQPAQPQ